jgi:DNA-binding response OmpR family regulator
MQIYKKILIFARADVLRDSLQTMLAGLFRGVEIDLLEDGALVASQIQRGTYDVVFLYPGLSFDTLLEAVRTIKAGATRIFTVMVIEEQDQMRLALEAGADQVILKGFSADLLMTSLQGIRIEKLTLNSRAHIL